MTTQWCKTNEKSIPTDVLFVEHLVILLSQAAAQGYLQEGLETLNDGAAG